MMRLNVGFRSETFGPFSAIFDRIAREDHGFDLRPMPKYGSGEEAELSVLGGELDFILGNHYTPLAAKAKDVHLCWLAVPTVDHNYKIATHSIDRAEDLVGKRVMIPRGSCPSLNMRLALRKMGLEDKVVIAHPEGKGGQWGSAWLDAVADRKVDATFVDSPIHITAQRRGLKLIDVPNVQVIAGPCITTTPGFASRDPEMTKELLRAYLRAIHEFKTNRDTVLEVVFEQGQEFGVHDQELGDAWYEARAARMFPRPYPTPEALQWTQAKAAIDYPEAASVNPLRLFELEYLQELDRDGFIDKIWAADPAGV